ncbi:hypothetical protein PCASD_15593 [Puccinia coronata f. sp. avenae]|uniref:Homeobox domain-containing protein n=1 Tax=Puccinia coronata f. sp. avenae TaxID=200324 RepID=A0A2N5TW60_9BASI|nr:hypothetical protein PCASD_15593 [Puccinia coronata f. sp. avenae]
MSASPPPSTDVKPEQGFVPTNMSASPPPSIDVTPEQGLSEAAGGQQHSAPPRRTSYSLFYHNTNEPKVYPESNWEHPSAQLPNLGDHHLVSPSSGNFSDAAFSQSTQSRLVKPAYPSSGTTQELDAPIAPVAGVPATRLAASPVPQLSQASSWSPGDNQAPRRRGKLPSAVTTILKSWLMANTTHPYPTEEEKKNLCKETNLTMNQVSNWFINARRRILVPPSAGNSVHEVRQPIRRQAQSHLVRAAGNAGAVRPYLTIRHVGSQSRSANTSPGIPMLSPISVGSSHLSSAAGSFDFRYRMTHDRSFFSGLCCQPLFLLNTNTVTAFFILSERFNSLSNSSSPPTFTAANCRLSPSNTYFAPFQLSAPFSSG